MARMTWSSLRAVVAVAAFVSVAPSGVASQSEPHVASLNRTRLAGVRVGSYRVGFEVRSRLDPTRRINREDGGTRIGVAMWYPAEAGGNQQAMTSLDYRLLEFSSPPSDNERQRYAEREADQAVKWRHVGVVPLTEAQALASLASGGIAIRGAPWRQGKFPVVMLFGGQYYLSTTAEMLASHGFVVVAPFRYSDRANDVGTEHFTWYMENSVRDAEWVLNDLRDVGGADVEHVSALGHGGGGLQALLFAMRNVNVRALANIDAGNFSTRSEARTIPFYSPRLLRAPYLFVATADTRKSQDLFADFLAMTSSCRFEVILQDAAVRHHDLSDLGHGVTAPLGIRGGDQEVVQQAYATVQDMVVRFLATYGAPGSDDAGRFAAWLRDRATPGHYTVDAHQ